MISVGRNGKALLGLANLNNWWALVHTACLWLSGTWPWVDWEQGRNGSEVVVGRGLGWLVCI